MDQQSNSYQQQGAPQFAPQGQYQQQAAPQFAPQGQYQQYPNGYVPMQQAGQPVMMAGVEQKSNLTYILLGVFFGALGVHNFYAGYTGRAIAQLLISVLTLFILSFISGIWAIIEVCTVRKDGKGIPFTR